LTVLRSTDLERRLAVRLGLPLNAADPEAERLCAKSSMRRLLEEAGIPVPPGHGGLRDRADLLEALAALARERPSARRAMVKLDTSFLDEGRMLVELPPAAGRDSLLAAIRQGHVPEEGEGPQAFLERFEREGGLVEEFVDAPERADASVQLRINPLGRVFLTSTHDEIRGGPERLEVRGCTFPAREEYRRQVQDLGLRIAGVLAERGVVSRVSVEFLLARDGPDRPWNPCVSKVNLGVGGSTHPLLAVRLLCEGELDPETGLFRSPSGRPMFYRCSDGLRSNAYRQLAPEDVVELLTLQQLNYSARSERGALFYMLGGVSATGRLGVVAIGHEPEDAEAVFARAVAVLDAACAAPS
jgi:hypothetical protein